MDYAESVHQVLLRKINKAEQDLMQLKLDYCRFIFNLTHRSLVRIDETVYKVQSVDLDSMTRDESGAFGKPDISGVPLDAPPGCEARNLGKGWSVVESVADEAGN